MANPAKTTIANTILLLCGVPRLLNEPMLPRWILASAGWNPAIVSDSRNDIRFFPSLDLVGAVKSPSHFLVRSAMMEQTENGWNK